MKSKEFDGRTAEMRGNTPWLASEDIDGLGDVEVTIESVFFHQGAEFDEGRKEDVYTVSFVGKQKQLVLNSTNRRSLVKKFGADTKNWRGKSVKLYVKDGIRAFGEVRKGIRIR